jgi:type II pantothenate kinase
LEDFEDVMKLAERGDPSKVDMMVGDIYGENSDALEKIGLTSNLVSGRRALGLVCGIAALR